MKEERDEARGKAQVANETEADCASDERLCTLKVTCLDKKKCKRDFAQTGCMNNDCKTTFLQKNLAHNLQKFAKVMKVEFSCPPPAKLTHLSPQCVKIIQ